MRSSNARRDRRPVFAEVLESRTLLSSTPTLADQLISTTKFERFHASTINGIPFTVKILNGTVDIFKIDNRIQLNVTGTDDTSQLIMLGHVQLADVTIAGSMKNFVDSDNLAGTMSVSGSISKLTLGGISGELAILGNLDNGHIGGIKGTLAVGGTITKLRTGALSNASILGGAVLVADSPIGSMNNTYAPGAIGTIIVAGPMINSNIAVGVSPGPDGVFGTPDDTLAGGGLIGSITLVNGADTTSRIEAGAFGIAKLRPINSTAPIKKLINPLSDSHFVIPPMAPT